MAGTWKAPVRPPGFNVGVMLLLTDCSVLAQDRGTRHWWRLVTDSYGGFRYGSWRQTRDSHYAPQRFASVVLGDGQVLVIGGELQNGQPEVTPSAELYDPVANRWSDVPPPPGWPRLGAAPICVLPDGRVLLGSITDNRCALFDPQTQGWTAAAAKPNANSALETWVLLENGSVLAVISNQHPAALSFDGNAWQSAGAVTPSLINAGQVGPALRLTGGQVLALGANGSSSLFDAGAWGAGPLLQDAGTPFVARHAPSVLLPDGSVLCALAPAAGGALVLFSLDRTGTTLTRLGNQPDTTAAAPEDCHLLLLPDGSVLFSNGTDALRYYDDPVMRPDPTWLPIISECHSSLAPGGSGRLRGTLICGLSQAHSQGAIAAMATNYPLVRLRATNGSLGAWYCRTGGHAPLGVATGATLQTTIFHVPERMPPGSYALALIANGIASIERPFVVLADQTGADRPLSTRELDLQYELFWRDLNEVHLLMDYVSGRADKSLSQLIDVPDPNNPKSKLDPQEVVQRVSMIRFPPVGSPTVRAQQASLLLAAKDKLNQLADPARGVSVAYTAMFVGIALTAHSASAGCWAKVSDFIGICLPHQDPDAARIRCGFATEAYPNLQEHAQKFSAEFIRLPYFTLFWAVLTAFVYWGASLTGTQLNAVAALEAKQADLIAGEHDFLLNHARCLTAVGDEYRFQERFDPRLPDPAARSAGPQQTSAGTEAPAADKEKPPRDGTRQPDSTDMKKACWSYLDLEQRLDSARVDLAAHTETHLWKNAVGWMMYAYTPHVRLRGNWRHPREQQVAVVLSVFTTYIVPMMFGVLGTLAGVIRSIWGKVAANVLRPMDRRLAVASIPLGIVAGMTVGLILAPSGSPVQGVTNVVGSVTLSASALAFLAGYGAELFFVMIDELLKRVFALGK